MVLVLVLRWWFVGGTRRVFKMVFLSRYRTVVVTFFLLFWKRAFQIHMSQKGGNYRLYGFPQNVTFQQIKDYLPQWLYGKNRMLSDLRKHRKSSSVLFTCPNFTDLNGREYKRLCKFLVETHFEGDFIVSIKKEIPTSTSNTNSKNKRKKRKDKDNDVPDALTLGFVEFIVFKKKVTTTVL